MVILHGKDRVVRVGLHPWRPVVVSDLEVPVRVGRVPKPGHLPRAVLDEVDHMVVVFSVRGKELLIGVHEVARLHICHLEVATLVGHVSTVDALLLPAVLLGARVDVLCVLKPLNEDGQIWPKQSDGRRRRRRTLSSFVQKRVPVLVLHAGLETSAWRRWLRWREYRCPERGAHAQVIILNDNKGLACIVNIQELDLFPAPVNEPKPSTVVISIHEPKRFDAVVGKRVPGELDGPVCRSRYRPGAGWRNRS